MSDPAHKPMTADGFIAWAMHQPEGERYELAGGEVVAMAPERSIHGLVKAWMAHRLMTAIGAAVLPCDVYVDRTAVRVDDTVVYEPDVLVRCGPRLPPDAVEVTDPVIVIEILAPPSRGTDLGAKFADYFRLPSLSHYLIANPRTRTIIHHHREADGTITSRIHHHGSLRLEPPGLELDAAFPPDR